MSHRATCHEVRRTGFLRTSADDFAMLRLVLVALLPQIGAVLLMIGRGAR